MISIHNPGYIEFVDGRKINILNTRRVDDLTVELTTDDGVYRVIRTEHDMNDCTNMRLYKSIPRKGLVLQPDFKHYILYR